MVQHVETAEHSATFEAYYVMGGDRSIKKLHQHCTNIAPKSTKVSSIRTLKNWSKWFHWQERIAIKDKAIAEGVDKKTTKASIDRRAKWLANIENRIASAFDNDGNPKFSIEEYKDLNDTIKLALILLGEPERKEVEHQHHEIKIIQVRSTARND